MGELNNKSEHQDKYAQGLEIKEKKDPIMLTEEKTTETDAKFTSAELVKEIEQIAKSISNDLNIEEKPPQGAGNQRLTYVDIKLHSSLILKLIVVETYQQGSCIKLKTLRGLVTIGDEQGLSKLKTADIKNQITEIIKGQIKERDLRLS